VLFGWRNVEQYKQKRRYSAALGNKKNTYINIILFSLLNMIK